MTCIICCEPADSDCARCVACEEELEEHIQGWATRAQKAEAKLAVWEVRVTDILILCRGVSDPLRKDIIAILDPDETGSGAEGDS